MGKIIAIADQKQIDADTTLLVIDHIAAETCREMFQKFSAFTKTDWQELKENIFYNLDNDIEEIIKQTFDITELEEEFYDKFTTVANSIYLEKEPSDYAKEYLGFSSLA